jgi:IS1 family transposase
MMIVRSNGVRDISIILNISVATVLQVLRKAKYQITQKQTHYDCLEIDESWTYVGRKSNKKWLLYAYHRETGEIVAYVWGNRDKRTANKLRKRLKKQGITYDRLAIDTWNGFKAAFKEDKKLVGKKYTVGNRG